MIFRPDPTRCRMGDHWMYEGQGLTHLFYMKRDVDGRFNRVGHATSDDLLHWEEHEDITIHPREGDWDYQNRITQTGYVIEHEDHYWMAYGSRDVLTQKIGWLVSDDLFHWNRPSSQPVMWPQRNIMYTRTRSRSSTGIGGAIPVLYAPREAGMLSSALAAIKSPLVGAAVSAEPGRATCCTGVPAPHLCARALSRHGGAGLLRAQWLPLFPLLDHVAQGHPPE